MDDVERAFKLEGKQGYGNARGIWQTPYLEARGASALATLHFTPDIDAKKATVEATLLEAAPRDLTLRLAFKTGSVAAVERRIPKGEARAKFEVAIPDPRLWSLEDPFLYEVEARLGAGTEPGEDVVTTYFGMRKISVVNLPGTDHPYVALNGEPVYLQLALDQAYHPEGFYTFPSDEFVRNEVLRARQIGLNGLREHVKVELPRKLYWADRLGVLIMADVPNSWGEPTPEMRQETEQTLRRMIRRDYNHPVDLFLDSLQRDVGPLPQPPEGAGREGTEEGLPARDAEMGGVGLPAGEIARRDAARRGQLGLLRARPHRDRPQLVARLPARLGLGRAARQGHEGHLPRLDLELRGRLQAGPPAQHQQRVRQRVGLRGLDGRRGLELGLSPRRQLVPPPSRRSRAGSTPSTTTSSTSGTATGASTAARSSRDWRTSPKA